MFRKLYAKLGPSKGTRKQWIKWISPKHPASSTPSLATRIDNFKVKSYIKGIMEKEETLQGQIENIIFYSEESNYIVAHFYDELSAKNTTIVGTMFETKPGEAFRLSGKWVNNKKFGKQFSFDSYISITPSTKEGIEKYLGSGLIKGIGPTMAKRLVEYFAEKTLDVIENRPGQLTLIKGIGKSRVEMIIGAWEKHAQIKSLMIFCHEHGVSTNIALKVFKKYKNRSIAIIQQNPFRLASEIWGVGFKKADQIALSIGFDEESPLRIASAIEFILEQISHEGHLHMQKHDLCMAAEELLNVSLDKINEAMEALCFNDRIRYDSDDQDNEVVYLKAFHDAEIGIAENITRLLSDVSDISINIEKALLWVEDLSKFSFSQSQKDAIEMAIKHKVSIITGGPGTGKTTIINEINKIFQAKGAVVYLSTPTGRASKRLSEATGHEAKTIHRMLEYSPKERRFIKDSENQLACDVLILDEASMIDTPLFYYLIRAIPDTSRLIIVGDVDQLPPVGPGNTLFELITSKLVPVTFLKYIFRQAQGSSIIEAAHQINSGNYPEFSENDRACVFVKKETSDEIIKSISDFISRIRSGEVKDFDLESTQILVPMNKGDIGTIAMNQLLQNIINPPSENKQSIKRIKYTFREADRIMQIVNNYDKEVFNGDIGCIEHINKDAEIVMCNFDGRLLEYEFAELDEIALAYAITIHKSQGSEYKNILILLSTQHFIMLQRNLIYTAITRGKEKVLFIGNPKALKMAVQRNFSKKRNTLLGQRLRKKW
ncbi:MAG: ATP-dependent RecD-like DNA helicase [Pseudomonadota bacterium]